MGVPAVDVRFTADGVIVPCTSQVNAIEAGAAPAGGVTVTGYRPIAVGFPVIRPEALIASPAGRPVAV